MSIPRYDYLLKYARFCENKKEICENFKDFMGIRKNLLELLRFNENKKEICKNYEDFVRIMKILLELVRFC